ncbi:MAG: ABC transporter permease [Clostridium sp.]|nr:ABC transporter permease [Clostridium sp.]
MLIENMLMAFSAIRSNKMRSALTMLGIIIGIGSVIAIVSIGDTMRSMFSDLYKDVGITQAYISIGYWVEDVRQSDYFTLDEMERAKEVFGDEIAYIDSNAYTTSDATYKRTKVSFEYQGIDYNYQDVQPVNVVYGRYLNEGDILGRKKNIVMDVDSARMLFGVENAVGKTFRTTIYGSTEDYTVVGVYRKEISPLQKLMQGGSNDKGTAFLPYTILTWPNDYFYNIHVYAADNVNLDQFFNKFKAYLAKLHGREPEDMYMYTAMEEMTSVDSMMGGLSMAVGGIAAISLLVGGIGIMNIMLVSVTERTREIGIRKALGARTKDVLIQFLTESAILSACGGMIGVLMGVGLVSLGGLAFGLPVVIKPSVILVAVSFSAMVGIFFGLYPASKAAKADPIDALRYE